ncbi:phosphate acetyltransferase [Corynebacterium sanguinis]|uniref:Phosphate acetyltransferase n=3 Tax=Corynebacterium sanguinis TaxID=2594913 RepID=A0A6C1TVV7_9CORY|nr:phosphate acetyltransferase [Corynebacterium sanguinis]MCT1411579.1 phosphate acetyltransferase [Corynebacterium sanguinis]MCT1463114.1 phosphate acetyltransferase [Corynebacterium sanguinis]MCT1492206.1 phosphate acetyltransferase [Corynebacterium sanguinis]MCT1585447.1 phosphate acetyltransferase [Corynebacterium sanguinis]MCT1596898.1 phosphate acetyltransferase [Corynebacterium sanguinis]
MADQSLLITLANRNYDGIDVEGFASKRGLRVVRLDSYGTDLQEMYDAHLLAEEPALVVGTGDVSFDGELAAALGIPVVLVTAEDANVELAERRLEELGAIVAGVFSAEQLADAEIAAVEARQVMSPVVFESWLIERAKEKRAHIVLPEGEDDRILQAAAQLLEDEVVDLTILGDQADIDRRAADLGLDLSAAQILNHLESDLLEEFAADFAELRKKKGISLDDARETMKDISYFGTMMVHKGIADGMVSGAAHTTAHTIKPSFQIIKTVPGASVVSSIFLMVMRDRLWAFGDCAVNPNPTAQQLGEIAAVSAKTASQFGIDPKVAMLSYSTGTSGSGPDVDRAVEAVAAAKKADPELIVDGPLQFDAACDPGVGKKKAPESPVAGQATVFIFPDLEAGNAGYKIAQRTGDALAIGPVLQGLNKPVNDLSRGATVPDIVNTVAITAIQAGALK